MKLIVTRYVAGKRGFYQGAEFLVGHVLRDEAVTGEDTLGVGVDDEGVLVAGIKKDGVGGLRADAVDGEELFAELGSGSLKHAREGTGVFRAKEADEGLQFFGFLAEIAGGADQGSEASKGNALKSAGGKEMLAAQVGDGALDVEPGSILSEDSADDDLEGCLCRPPVLRAEVVKESLVV
jgi:hypothetical protein